MRLAGQTIIVRNPRTGLTICTSARVADGFWSRLVGLLGETNLEAESGLWILPSSGVHTFWMKFAIDVVALDAQRRVIGVWRSVGPGKIRALSPKTRSVLELTAGRIAETGIQVGDVLDLQRMK